METTKIRKKKKRNNKGKLVLLIFIAFILLGNFYYKKGFTAVSIENPKEINIEIPTGSTSSKIASILKREGLIRNEFIFKIAVKNNKADGKLKAGTYFLNTGMDVNDIIAQLSRGGKNENVVKFTIPEGYEIRQVADKLEKQGLVDKEKFLNLTSDKKYFQNEYPILKELKDGQSLEGFLFPSTYEIFVNSTEEDIIKKMLTKFEEIYQEDVKKNMGKVDLSLNEVVTLASIIEREAKREDERELISAVFHNRLKQGMLLQSCATVQYALGERKEVLSDKDTQIESKYNTYIHEGLPPAPIASPGRESLIAAINPADVDYLYFRTKEDGTGGHTFSRTYEEHKNAKPKK